MIVAIALAAAGSALRSPAAPVLSEVLCDNASSLVDWRGEHSDWIEIYNPGPDNENLAGWYLTDDPADLTKWQFPAIPLRSGRFQVIFASGLDANEVTDARVPHASFKLSADGEYLALVKPDGTTIAHALEFSDVPQHTDVSYGLPLDDTGFRIDVNGTPKFLASPTPMQANDQALDGIIEPVLASKPHGFYDAPFDLELASATPDVEIRYTTDGSEPSPLNGELLTGKLTVDHTTTLRAIAVRSNWKSSPVMTRTYLFLDDIVHQSSNGEAPEGWPEGQVNGQVLDYGMDPDIVEKLATPAEVKEALRSLPTLSVVTSIENLFDPDRGIYANPQQKGREWERPSSFELIDPDGKTEGFQVNAGLRLRGGFSRTPSNPKHAMRLIFRSEYGSAKLKYPLFEEEGVKSFDFIDIRTSLNWSWAMGGSTRNTLLRDVFARDSQGAMGQPYTRSRFYHLYLNGNYWGIYQTQERVTDSYGASYLDGDKDDFDVIKTQGQVAAGNSDALTRLFRAAVKGFRNDADYFAVQGMRLDGSRAPEFERLLDIDNLIDYMLILFYTGNNDGPGGVHVSWPNNYYSIYNRKQPDGFKYFAHDMEHTLDVGTYDMTLSDNATLTRPEYINPYSLHVRLVENAQYRKRFKERTEMHFFGEGVFADDVAVARLNKHAAQIEKAILAHSARWGDASSPKPRTPTDWKRAVDRSRNWLKGRGNAVISQFVRRGWYDGQLPPKFVRGRGDNLFLMSDGGTIYFTTDGTDPLRGDGDLNPDAREAKQPTIEKTVLLSADAPIRSLVPTDDQADGHWHLPEFDDLSWTAGIPGVGYDDDGDYLSAIRLDVSETLRGRNLTIYLRSHFDVSTTAFDRMVLGMKFDDGFVAYLNGSRLAAANAPPYLDWQSRAPEKGNDSEALMWQAFSAPATLQLKKSGNVLAIHGLNQSLDSSDFLITPSLMGLQFSGGTIVVDQLEAWPKVVARVRSDDGKWSPPARFDPAAPASESELFGAD
ncbi:MAG: CotH kinase family protein [Verrucomicrobia bacterium]|nr:CotH kinase family protein [Verrucomicrobiota bacterium]